MAEDTRGSSSLPIAGAYDKVISHSVLGNTAEVTPGQLQPAPEGTGFQGTSPPPLQAGIDDRPPAPIPRNRTQPISGYEPVAPQADNDIYATPRSTIHRLPTQRQKVSGQQPDENSPLMYGPPEQLEEITETLLTCLGIGRWYWGVCLFISVTLFAAGICLIAIISTRDLENTKLVSNIVCGVSLLLLSLLWPGAWMCNRLHGRKRKWSFRLLFLCAWLASLYYAGSVGALATAVKDDYRCFPNCSDPASLWVLIGMIIISIFLASIVCIFGICITCRTPTQN